MRFTCESFTEHHTVEHQPTSLSPPSLSITNFTFQSFSFHHFMLMITQNQFSASNNNQTQCVFNFSTFSTYRKKTRATAFTFDECHSNPLTLHRADLHPFTNFTIFTIIWNVHECAQHTRWTLNTEQCEVYVASTAAMSAIANFGHAQPFICSFFAYFEFSVFYFEYQ